MNRIRMTTQCLFVIAIAAALSRSVFAQELPAGTVVLSKMHPNKELIESGFSPVKAELGASWERLRMPPLSLKETKNRQPKAVSFKGALWLLTGMEDGVWRLDGDGEWLQVSESLPMRFDSVTAHGGRIWVTSLAPIGLWSSADGKEWESATNGLPWDIAGRPQLVSHGNSLLGIGNRAVWLYKGNSEWESISTEAPWGGVTLSECVSLNNKLWSVGGMRPHESTTTFRGKSRVTQTHMTTSSVWVSTDGREWECVAEEASFPPRVFHSCVAAEGKIWIIGGVSRDDGRDDRNDVWCSSDGLTWTEAVHHAEWEQRNGLSVVFFQGRLFGVGGMSYSVIFEDGWATSPVHRNSDGFYYYEKQASTGSAIAHE